MKVQVNITAQYFENYSDTNTPHWKPKGGADFSVMADDDAFLYCEEQCVEVIKALLAERSNDGQRYEYRSHELQFHDTIVLSSLEFESRLENLLAQKVAEREAQ